MVYATPLFVFAPTDRETKVTFLRCWRGSVLRTFSTHAVIEESIWCAGMWGAQSKELEKRARPKMLQNGFLPPPFLDGSGRGVAAQESCQNTERLKDEAGDQCSTDIVNSLRTDRVHTDGKKNQLSGPRRGMVEGSRRAAWASKSPWLQPSIWPSSQPSHLVRNIEPPWVETAPWTAVDAGTPRPDKRRPTSSTLSHPPSRECMQMARITATGESRN
ncbi:hypothetical protein B0T16DRAFT_67715 [Cercophora newfieldiana]|uniref:Uncharacterized protein n=1 Tax=Cercophora newfieldiana TaxID=92897 RepID=A0AA39YSD8_9PEZI|nr:hypothetical protein B0T16DRAFT_67715 [Cercophora newfieldiana]